MFKLGKAVKRFSAAMAALTALTVCAGAQEYRWKDFEGFNAGDTMYAGTQLAADNNFSFLDEGRFTVVDLDGNKAVRFTGTQLHDAHVTMTQTSTMDAHEPAHYTFEMKFKVPEYLVNDNSWPIFGVYARLVGNKQGDRYKFQMPLWGLDNIRLYKHITDAGFVLMKDPKTNESALGRTPANGVKTDKWYSLKMAVSNIAGKAVIHTRVVEEGGRVFVNFTGHDDGTLVQGTLQGGAPYGQNVQSRLRLILPPASQVPQGYYIDNLYQADLKEITISRDVNHVRSYAQLSPNSEITANAYVAGDGTAEKKASLILAYYDADGALSKVAATEQTATAADPLKLVETKITLPQGSIAGGKVKAFMWSGMDTLEPVTAARVLE